MYYSKRLHNAMQWLKTFLKSQSQSYRVSHIEANGCECQKDQHFFELWCLLSGFRRFGHLSFINQFSKKYVAEDFGIMKMFTSKYQCFYSSCPFYCYECIQPFIFMNEYENEHLPHLLLMQKIEIQIPCSIYQVVLKVS